MFRHPKYYKNLRKLARNRELQKIVDGIAASATDQAISGAEATAEVERATGPGPKQQATSIKLQGTSVKLKATSNKLLDPGPSKKFQAP